MFGAEVERYVGPRRLLACYFASVVSAGLSQLFIPMLFGAPPAPTIGASGGVFGLLLAYAFLFPRRKVIPLFPPIPMPAWLFATFYTGVELFLGVTGTLSGVAHFAHLGGMVGSALVLTQWRLARARGWISRRDIFHVRRRGKRLGYAPMKRKMKSIAYLAAFVCLAA